MSSVSVTAELELFRWRQLQDFLESRTDFHDIVLAASLPSRPRPEADSEEALPDIDDHAHYFVVILVFECLAYGC